MKKTRLFTFLIASIFALAISAQGIVVHQNNSKKVSFKSTNVQKIEFTEDQVENSTDNYVEKSELEDLLGKLRDEINLKLDRTDADKIWKEIEKILGLYSELSDNKVDKSTHEIAISSLRKDIEDKDKASRLELDKALKKIDELSDLVKDLQSKIGTDGGAGGDNSGGSGGTSTNNEHEYVDLGLPSGLKWATMNVGAESPEDYGDYFAWGETEPYYTEGHSQDNPCSNWKTNKTGYDWASYNLCKGSDESQTKYCTSSFYGTVDNKTVLDLEDDAAHVNWGGDWRMPTKEEKDELRTKCTWTWGSKNGVNGYTVFGPNGNSLFLPAAGGRRNSNLFDVGSFGYYWSSSLYSGSSSHAYGLYFGSSRVYSDNSSRLYGFAVRPVCQ